MYVIRQKGWTRPRESKSSWPKLSGPASVILRLDRHEACTGLDIAESTRLHCARKYSYIYLHVFHIFR